MTKKLTEDQHREIAIARSRLERRGLPADVADVVQYVASRPTQFTIAPEDVPANWPPRWTPLG